jgi:hypothetical protein
MVCDTFEDFKDLTYGFVVVVVITFLVVVITGFVVVGASVVVSGTVVVVVRYSVVVIEDGWDVVAEVMILTSSSTFELPEAVNTTQVATTNKIPAIFII